MGKFGWIAGIVVVIVAVAALAMGDMFKRGTWRYELTIAVETPEGVKTGSAVREVIVQRQPDILPDVAAANATVRGEAVVVDLGERGVLFAPLGGDAAYMIVFRAFNGPPGLTPEGIEYFSRLEAKTILKPELYPKLVTFTDLSDPKSIMPVEPGNLAATFGEGVSLKEITIEMTEEDVTEGKIESVLHWIYERRIGLDFYDPDKPHPANYLTNSDFVKGVLK